MEHRRSTPYASACTSISHIARGVCRPILKKHGLHSADIFLSWGDMIGLHYARSTLPIRLQASSNGQTILHVQVLREQVLEIRYNTTKLIARINQYFGHPCVHQFFLHPVSYIAPPVVETPITHTAQEDDMEEDTSLETLLKRLERYLK